MSRSGKSEKPVGLIDEAGVVKRDVIDAIAAERGDLGRKTREMVEKYAPGGSRARVISALLDEADSPVSFEILPAREEALTRLRARELQSVVVVPSDYLARGAIETYQTEATPFNKGGARVERVLTPAPRRSLSAWHLPDDVL